MPESSAIAGCPVAAAATRALARAFCAKVVPVSGGSSICLGQRVELVRAHQPLQLAQLVWITGGEDEPHRYAVAAPTASSWAARSCSMPAAASASSSSSEARESGVRSAVAWTSTSPPSPVITTLASTSAVESSE